VEGEIREEISLRVYNQKCKKKRSMCNICRQPKPTKKRRRHPMIASNTENQLEEGKRRKRNIPG